MGDNIDQVVYDSIYTVTGISEDGQWYRLKSGLYITTGKQYVLFMEKLPEQLSYLVKVTIPDLNIRRGPGINYDKTGEYTGTGVFTIVEEADGEGAEKWGLLKSYQKNLHGWIALNFTTRV